MLRTEFIFWSFEFPKIFLNLTIVVPLGSIERFSGVFIYAPHSHKTKKVKEQ